MPAGPTVERLGFKINGSTDDAWSQDLREIVVENTMRMPSMCTITLYDGMSINENFAYMESSTFKLGAEVVVFVLESSPETSVFKGEIAAIEPVFEEDGSSSLLIRAYDKMHRLHRGKTTQTFLKQKDSQVVSKLLGEAGLATGTVEDTKVIHEFLIQNNQTALEWISMRADALGFQYYMEDGKFHFKSPDSFDESLVKVKWGLDLRSFRVRVAATHQPGEVAVHGWDQVKKQEIVGVSSSDPTKASVTVAAQTKSGGKAADVFGAAKTTVTTMPVVDADTAQAIAVGQHRNVDGEFIRAEGIAMGNGMIKAGRYIETEGVGQYSGKYFVTTVRHVFRSSGRWETQFSVNGRTSTSLLQVMNGRSHSGLYNNRISGVVPALVTNQKDPLDLGRVKVKYPWMPSSGGGIESDWVRVAAPGAGKNRGFYWIPEVGDEVLVAFEHGDPHRPYIVGALWNQKDLPPETNSTAAAAGTTQRILKSRTGHIMTMDDSDGAAKILISDSTNKNSILIDTKQNSITVTADKDITLTAKGNITLDAKGKVDIKSGMDTAITATAAFKVSAKAPSEIKVTGPLTIDGLTVTVKASTQLSMSANAMAEMKSSGMVVIQGTLVKIN